MFRELSDRPHDMNVTEGDTVVLRCAADAEPGATIQWMRNGKLFDGMSLYATPQQYYHFINHYRPNVMTPFVRFGPQTTLGGK